MAFAIDNRYCIGSSGATPPDEAYVAYGARWIDQGDLMHADVVPDRQGFAYADREDYERLVTRLGEVDARTLPCEINYDVTETFYDGTEDDGFALVMRRAGGYVYVDAWLVAS